MPQHIKASIPSAVESSGHSASSGFSLTLFSPFSETADAPASTSTPYTISPGDTFDGTIATIGDTDWLRIDLMAGQTYVIDLYGTGGSAGLDTYLRVYNDSGFLLGDNDDEDFWSGDISSQMIFSVATTGTYYIEADTFASQYTGTYQINVSSGTTTTTPVFSYQQIADYLSVGFWQDVGQTVRSFAISYGGTLDVDISGLTAPVQQLALWALDAWSTASGIIFNTSLAGGVIADIVIDDQNDDAYTTFPSISGSTIIQASVNVGTNWTDFYGTNFDSYSLLTFIHEIGHALGLGHAGNYNASASYGTDNHYLNDSWQATVMSYFDQLDNSYITASFAFAITPMIADIIAIQAMYGVDPSLRSGNTIYGENSNAGGTYAIVSQMISADTLVNPITMTIVDQGGVDLLDLRSDAADQRIDLASGTVSDVYGGVGNLSIAIGTVLENVLAGAGNDTITGNSTNNSLSGNAGSDVLFGHIGFDTLYGGSGNDTLLGGGQNDTLHGGTGFDRLEGEAGNDVLYGDLGIDELYGGFGFDTLYGGDHNDRLFGGLGLDTLYGEDGDDRLEGGGHNDLLLGGLGNDVIYGGFGFDRLEGAGGDDRLYGQLGRDLLFGGFGYDLLDGGSGIDTLNGGLGLDTLDGGADDDLLTGGGQSDLFVFADGFGNDVITDFDALDAGEQIDLSGVTAITDLADLLANHASQVGGDVVIDDLAGNTITLVGVTLGDLDTTDFVF